jgi:8-oxo-dGTP pyrophosphatase MutT (NUDIX family)
VETVEVAAALIQDDAGRYLIARRRRGSHLAGLWEFPGGKREEQETLEACLRRELVEELNAEFESARKSTPSAGSIPKRPSCSTSTAAAWNVAPSSRARAKLSNGWRRPASTITSFLPPTSR